MDKRRAVRLWGAAVVAREHLGIPLPPVDRAIYDCTMTAVRAELDDTAWQAAWAEGRAMTREQAIAYALALASPQDRSS